MKKNLMLRVCICITLVCASAVNADASAKKDLKNYWNQFKEKPRDSAVTGDIQITGEYAPCVTGVLAGKIFHGGGGVLGAALDISGFRLGLIAGGRYYPGISQGYNDGTNWISFYPMNYFATIPFALTVGYAFTIPRIMKIVPTIGAGGAYSFAIVSPQGMSYFGTSSEQVYMQTMHLYARASLEVWFQITHGFFITVGGVVTMNVETNMGFSMVIFPGATLGVVFKL